MLIKSDAEITRGQSARLSRAPFHVKLAQILGHGPSDQAIADLAEKSPDRWAKLVAIFARVAGYSDLSQVEMGVTQRIEEMSDSELTEALAKLQATVEVVRLDTQSNVDM